MPQEFEEQLTSIQQNLKTDFANTNEQFVRKALVTDQTPIEITNRIIKDYCNVYQPMAIELMAEIGKLSEIEMQQLPQLKFRSFLINTDYIPTNEAPSEHLL